MTDNIKIPLSKPYFDEDEIDQISAVLNSGWVAGQGPASSKLADQITHLTNSSYCIPVNNCTAGLHLALLAIGVGHGDEVIVSDYTHIQQLGIVLCILVLLQFFVMLILILLT